MIRRLGLILGACALLALAFAAWWVWPADVGAGLRAGAAPLERVLREPRPDLGPRVERWRLVTTRGDTVWALWRPAAASGRRWTAVMLGGIGTDDRAALLVPDPLPVSLLAVSWPWRGPRRMPAHELARRLPEIRDAALASPAALALGLAAVSRTPGVDTSRIALLGVSLGVPPATAALAISNVPDALVLVDGAADLGRVLAQGLEREGVAPRLAAPLGALGGRLLRPLEPWHHRRAAARLPVLLVNSRADELLPRAAVERLHAALPHAEVRWRDGVHIRPEQGARIAALADAIRRWLERLPR